MLQRRQSSQRLLCRFATFVPLREINAHICNMNLPLVSVFFILILCSCKVTEQNISGTYRLKDASKTKLVLNKDKTFEFEKNFNHPGPAFFPDSTELNFRTTGRWQLEKGQLVLNSFRAPANHSQSARDSIIRNTDITSISFWDKYGDPIDIRMIRFPENRTKLHKGNTISFFAQDFTNTDTLEFHFYGYLPFRWIPTAGSNINNQHRVTIYETLRQGYFINMFLTAKGKKISHADKSFYLIKSEE